MPGRGGRRKGNPLAIGIPGQLRESDLLSAGLWDAGLWIPYSSPEFAGVDSQFAGEILWRARAAVREFLFRGLWEQLCRSPGDQPVPRILQLSGREHRSDWGHRFCQVDGRMESSAAALQKVWR